MTNPDYAVVFLNVSTVVTATILGFVIISWIFWWENLGKNIKFELGIRYRGYRLKKFYIGFENNFFKRFIKTKILFPYFKKTYGDILRITKLGFLYVIIKRKTENIYIRWEYKRINYGKSYFLALLLYLIIIGIYYISANVYYLHRITLFTTEKLSKDTALQPMLNNSFNVFLLFIGLFTIYILSIIFHSFYYKKSKLGKSRYEIDYIQ